MLTLDALFVQPDHAAVLRWMERHLASVHRQVEPIAAVLHWPEDIRHFKASTEGHPLDEGGWIFFHTYGRRIPAAARCCVEIYNLLAHERTARIFALNVGRFSIALRRDFSRWDVSDGDRLRYGETLDGTFDVRSLGPSWVVFHDEDDDAEPEEVFLWAYELAGR